MKGDGFHGKTIEAAVGLDGDGVGQLRVYEDVKGFVMVLHDSIAISYQRYAMLSDGLDVPYASMFLI